MTNAYAPHKFKDPSQIALGQIAAQRELAAQLARLEQIVAKLTQDLQNPQSASSDRLAALETAAKDMAQRLQVLESQRGPGRPKGSKNKPKVKNEAAEATAPQGMAEGAPAQDGDVAG